jgi:hypothetical protein
MGQSLEEVFKLLDGSVLRENVSRLVNYAVGVVSDLHE